VDESASSDQSGDASLGVGHVAGSKNVFVVVATTNFCVHAAGAGFTVT
jgi:hypothetical protein